MKQVITRAVLELPAGAVVQLNETQAKPRAHALKALGEGKYEARVPLCFKAGETFGFDGEMPKAQSALLEAVSAGARAAARAKGLAADLLGAAK